MTDADLATGAVTGPPVPGGRLIDLAGQQLFVRDTGPPGGVTRPAAGEQAHGLIGMRERAALYGGTVSAGPTPGGGWTVTADLEVPA